MESNTIKEPSEEIIEDKIKVAYVSSRIFSFISLIFIFSSFFDLYEDSFIVNLLFIISTLVLSIYYHFKETFFKKQLADLKKFNEKKQKSIFSKKMWR